MKTKKMIITAAALVSISIFCSATNYCENLKGNENEPEQTVLIVKHENKNVMEHLTKETFKEKVFDFEIKKDWDFKGDLPIMIDFYADWCGPCKMVSPILEELASEYEGKIQIYKVNTEHEQELSAAFGIRSIPSFLFIPKEGQPQMAQGALPKDSFKQAINDILLKEKVTQ